MAASLQPSAPLSDSQSSYDQPVKKECRSRLIEHAVTHLTTERDTSVCVQRDHVSRVWRQLHETGEQMFFSSQERENIEKEILQWERFHKSQVQTREPSDLRVCYLAGDNPINDLQVLVDHGVLPQNVWAVEKDSATLKTAWESIRDSTLRNVRLFKGDILVFLKDFEGQFDIIYYDACGTLPAAKQNTLKFIGYVFLYNKLTSPGALITNFSFKPKRIEQQQDAPILEGASFSPEQTAQEQDALTQDETNFSHEEPHKNKQIEAKPVPERDTIRALSVEYLKHRLVNTLKDDNWPENNAEELLSRTDEENYSDYITFQVIDSAYLYIPAQRMLSSTKYGSSFPLWDQIFLKKQKFLGKISSVQNVDCEKDSNSKATCSKSEPTTTPILEDNNKPHETSETSKSPEQQLQEAVNNMEHLLKDTIRESYLSAIGSTMRLMSTKGNHLCKAWISEIFPDRESPTCILKNSEIASLLLTHLLSYSFQVIIKFANQDFQKKCLGPLYKALDGWFPRFCDVPGVESTTSMVAGLLYGQMAYPSFPVVDKLLRLRYTAKKRQMFSDVIIFDKCRYVYEQFPSVDFSIFALHELHQQMVFRMVVDGLRKHLIRICESDVFQFCNVASVNAMKDGGVSFSECWAPKIPERQEVEKLLFNKLKEVGNTLVKRKKYEEAIESYNKCQVLCPENAIIYNNKALCFLKLYQPGEALSNCKQVLKLDSGNLKALYRAAMAYKMQKNHSEAVNCLEKLLTIEEENEDAKRELIKCKKLVDMASS